LYDGLEKGIAILNVNIPSSDDPTTPIKITSQSCQKYYTFTLPGNRDFSQGYRFVDEISVDQECLEETSDIRALIVDKVVSITPLTWNLTAQCKWNISIKKIRY